jgi:hypothetical protein
MSGSGIQSTDKSKYGTYKQVEKLHRYPSRVVIRIFELDPNQTRSTYIRISNRFPDPERDKNEELDVLSGGLWASPEAWKSFVRGLSSMRIRIRMQLFTLMRIRTLLLIKEMRICDHWSTEAH